MKMKRSRTYFTLVCLLVVIVAAMATALMTAGSAAVPPQNKTTEAKTPAKSQRKHQARGDKAQIGQAGSADTNIKMQRTPNSKNASAPAPQAKGGPKSRAELCRFHVDNRTAYTIDVYTDGDYRGSVGPWDDVYGWIEDGASLYARADFDDGTYKYWNRRASYCPMTWILYP